MSDVLLRYLLTARERERSTMRRLFLADDPLLEAGVEDLVETAAARIGVTSQHERISQRSVTVPASRHKSVTFYAVPLPNPPKDGRFEDRTDEFPLRNTLRVYTCTNCGGSGEVRCHWCGGSGRTTCGGCGGSGRQTNSEGKSVTCSGCGGGGRNTCSGCWGSGEVTCDECDGEGRLASWQATVYQWLIEQRSKEEYPLAAEESRIYRAFHRWLKVDSERLESFDPAVVCEHLGFKTAEALEVAGRARDRRLSLEQQAKSSDDRYMFHRSEMSLAPVGYTVVRLAGDARFYWLIGRGEQALEVKPRGRLDGVKCLGWLGFGSGSTMAYGSAGQALELAEALQLFAEVPPSLLTTGAGASWLLTYAAIRRVRRRKPPIPALGLISAGPPTALLTCLAYLGSYLGHLKVLDRAYDLQSQRLLAGTRPNRQSESLGVELGDGRRVRLVEVANPEGLSTEQIRLIAEALDAVLVLEEAEHDASELRAAIEAAADPPPAIGTLRIDNELGLSDESQALPLDALRRAFVEDMASDVDWQAHFDRMWQPMERLLEDSSE